MTRALLIIALVASTAAVARVSRGPAAPPPIVAALPYGIGPWSGADAAPFDAETERILAADTYVNRTYTAGVQAPVSLYVAYYARQRPTVSIHSPLHCLPGTGWETLEVGTVGVPRGDGSIGRARRMIVRKNLDRALVLYWYDIHGRMLAGELASKAWLLHDSVRFGRNDAALVRIVVPVRSSPADAEREAVAFARAVMPYAS